MGSGGGDRAGLNIGGGRLVWGERTYVMGVLNATPDSFSGDGVGGDRVALGRRIDELVAEQPDIIDVGGESTRPGAVEITADEELDRVIPAIEAVRAATELPISIDTRRAAVARAALRAGADAINDVTGLAFDPALAQVAAEAGVPVVVTHNRQARAVRSAIGGHYQTVPYKDLIGDIIADTTQIVDRATAAGIRRDRLIFDPGFGFGKSPQQSLEVLRRLEELRVVDLPMLVGLSRKSVVGHALNASMSDRLEGSLAAAVIAVGKGADIVRAHDVAATRRAVALADAIHRRS